MPEPISVRTDVVALSAAGGATTASAPGVFHAVCCRCAACRIAMHVADSPKPSVCPYCQAKMTAAPYVLPPAIASVLDLDDDVATKLRRLYSRPRRGMVMALFLLGTGLLATAVYFQISNFESYWYAPLVNLYSLIAGVFIVSRFLLAAFYHAPLDTGFEPTVTVIVPCRNEQTAIGRTIDLIYAEGYPLRKKEVVVVNDGSTDSTLAEMLKAQARHPTLVIVDFETNRGLCHGMAVAALMARGEFLVFVDSDTFLFPGAVRKLVQGFVDPMVGGIAGHTDVENAEKNLLTKMQDVRYFFSYKIMKAAESVFGAVSCLPGCFSAYR
ncbi:MAG: glycosyltransferase family 2 protein, partial [bacterium]